MEDMKNSPVKIAIEENGIKVMSGGDKRTESIEGLAKLEQPVTPAEPATTLPDVPTPLDQTKQIRELTNKSLLCAMEKLHTMLTGNIDPAVIAHWMDLTLKLLDARESYLWADAFRAAVLKNPKLMSPNGKGLGPKGFDTRSNGAILQRLERGDTRTTPKRLIASMPTDDIEPAALTG